VRVALSDARSTEHGATLRGSGTRGWTLTAKGLKWASQIANVSSNLTMENGAARERGGSVDAQRIDRERSRLQATAAWSKWPSRAVEISVGEAQEVFRLDSYATDELRTSKVDRVRKLFIEDDGVLDFLEYLDNLLAEKKADI
jgi:hypothetical protein